MADEAAEAPPADVSLRPLVAEDLPRVAEWLAEPHVAAWWKEPSEFAAVRDRYLPCVTGEDPTEIFVIEVKARPAGLIQRYLIADDPDWARAMAVAPVPVDRAAGIDYLIGNPALTGRGIGSVTIAIFTDRTFRRYPRAEAVTAAVQQANRPSWRALERAGFVRVWAGQLDSDDPSDAGPAYVYAKRRPA
ncbi:GNAT family N-acetyltransferase [Rugosimonospora acidiphila]|uniref:Lysine N-acyltransferase MbtK n=1 Tax=Rugosimonospora acidiphila TaxID=556531 RepID=A0ABP9SK05_9ACTN